MVRGMARFHQRFAMYSRQRHVGGRRHYIFEAEKRRSAGAVNSLVLRIMDFQNKVLE